MIIKYPEYNYKGYKATVEIDTETGVWECTILNTCPLVKLQATDRDTLLSRYYAHVDFHLFKSK